MVSKLIDILMYYAHGSPKTLQGLFDDMLHDAIHSPEYSWLIQTLKPYLRQYGGTKVMDIIAMKDDSRIHDNTPTNTGAN